jgi:ABC-2 type transport system permease protein
VAGVLTAGPADAPVRDVAGALIGMRRALERNSPGGSGTVLGLRTIGLLLGIGTLLCGLIRFEDPSRMVDLLATLGLAWLVGWVMGPIVVRGAGLGLRPEWFALLPLPPAAWPPGCSAPPSPGSRQRSP